ncbi:MAG: 50S ribosomal protein L35 [Clostridia bacterium]|nr:50S ribosomal protein L35 [Oscillospiraceae bacterium]MBQ2829297.1 50S ribosomal protein L35 [Clostridia bacterium]
MPKIKTHSGAKKRFKLSKNGKPMRGHAYKSHILNKKTTKRKRNLRKTTVADVTNVKQIKKLIPYK